MRFAVFAFSWAALFVAPVLADEVEGQRFIDAANQLGVMHYCQAKGYVGAEMITAQEQLLEKMAQQFPGDFRNAEAEDAARRLGESGVVAAKGKEMRLAEGAAQQSRTEEELCLEMAKRMAEALR